MLTTLFVSEPELAVATVDRPALGLVAAQEALLVKLRVGSSTIEFVLAIVDNADDLAGLLPKPGKELLQSCEGLRVVWFSVCVGRSAHGGLYNSFTLPVTSS